MPRPASCLAQPVPVHMFIHTDPSRHVRRERESLFYARSKYLEVPVVLGFIRGAAESSAHASAEYTRVSVCIKDIQARGYVQRAVRRF
jgi:hypothetical protein